MNIIKFLLDFNTIIKIIVKSKLRQKILEKKIKNIFLFSLIIDLFMIFSQFLTTLKFKYLKK